MEALEFLDITCPSFGKAFYRLLHSASHNSFEIGHIVESSLGPFDFH